MVPHPLPVGGGTLLDNRLHIGGGISIHPPREGRDLRLRFCLLLEDNFNPPSPWGEGQQKYTKILFYFMHF